MDLYSNDGKYLLISIGKKDGSKIFHATQAADVISVIIFERHRAFILWSQEVTLPWELQVLHVGG